MGLATLTGNYVLTANTDLTNCHDVRNGVLSIGLERPHVSPISSEANLNLVSNDDPTGSSDVAIHGP